MRYQRRAHKGSRPEGLGHPRETQHTAVSYQAKYKGLRANSNFIRRYARMLRREAA